jgi:hypothetical protein
MVPNFCQPFRSAETAMSAARVWPAIQQKRRNLRFGWLSRIMFELKVKSEKDIDDDIPFAPEWR